jgi:hypothetical protein
MLFLIAILSVLAAAVLVAVFVRHSLFISTEERTPVAELPPASFRPLFEPGEEELREAERLEGLRAEEIERQRSLKQTEEKLAIFNQLRHTWAKSPTRAATVRLLYEASMMGRGELYQEVCGSVLEVWSAGNIAELSREDLARLLESHFWLLPDSERTPGVSFLLQEEIAGLRRASVKH